jgi:hypothetical protein
MRFDVRCEELDDEGRDHVIALTLRALDVAREQAREGRVPGLDERELCRVAIYAGVHIVTGIAALELVSAKKNTEALVVALGLTIGLLLGTERETQRQGEL